MATNHFGPFLLTGLLLPQLVARAATVVAVSSLIHPFARQGAARRPAADRPLRDVARLRADQAREPVLHRRVRPPAPGGRASGAGSRRPPRLRRHPPGRQRSVRPLDRWHRLDPRRRREGGRPARRGGAWPTLMAATADLPGSTYWRAERTGRAAWRARGRRQHQDRTRRVRPAPAVGAQRARDGDPLPLRREWSVRVVRHDLVVETAGEFNRWMQQRADLWVVRVVRRGLRRGS